MNACEQLARSHYWAVRGAFTYVKSKLFGHAFLQSSCNCSVDGQGFLFLGKAWWHNELDGRGWPGASIPLLRRTLGIRHCVQHDCYKVGLHFCHQILSMPSTARVAWVTHSGITWHKASVCGFRGTSGMRRRTSLESRVPAELDVSSCMRLSRTSSSLKRSRASWISGFCGSLCLQWVSRPVYTCTQCHCTSVRTTIYCTCSVQNAGTPDIC